MSRALAQRQAWLLTAITAQEPPLRPSAVLAKTAVSAEVGLEVYRNAYRSRLRECVIDDFPALQKVLGEALFANLADRYIQEFPPRASTLNSYSKNFIPWLRQKKIRHRAFCAQLAELEWALVEAIHAPLAQPLALAELQALPADGWMNARLITIPSLRIIRTTWAINATYNAYRANLPLPALARHDGAVVVYRRAQGLQRLELDRNQTQVLVRLAQQKTLGQALSSFDPKAAATIQVTFQNWFTAGLFSRLS